LRENENASDTQSDLVLAPTRSPLAPHRFGDLLERGLGRTKERLALSSPLGRKERVLRTHEALARIIGMSDLKQVGLVEKAELDRAHFDEGLDLGRA
jgi:hypothetical protein